MFTRYEKQLQEEEVSLQQQRSRLYKELAEEKENLAQLASRWGQRSPVGFFVGFAQSSITRGSFKIIWRIGDI